MVKNLPAMQKTWIWSLGWEDPLEKETAVCMLSHFSRVWLFATLWTVAHQASLFMGFSRQEYWSGLPCPPSEDHPNLGIRLTCACVSCIAGWLFPTEPPGKPGMSTHSNILAWRIPWAKEPGKLQSMELKRAGHEWVTNIFTFMVKCYIAMRKNRQLLHVAIHMTPLNIILGKRNQAQSSTYIHLYGIQKQIKWTCDGRDQNSVCSVGVLVGRVHEIAFWAQEMFWILIEWCL